MYVVAGSAQSRVEKKTEKLTVCEKKHCCRILCTNVWAISRSASAFGVRVDPIVEKIPSSQTCLEVIDDYEKLRLDKSFPRETLLAVSTKYNLLFLSKKLREVVHS